MPLVVRGSLRSGSMPPSVYVLAPGTRAVAGLLAGAVGVGFLWSLAGGESSSSTVVLGLLALLLCWRFVRMTTRITLTDQG